MPAVYGSGLKESEAETGGFGLVRGAASVRVAVGLRAFRVLANYALSSERGGQVVDTRSP